jgi:hypothetical protein
MILSPEQRNTFTKFPFFLNNNTARKYNPSATRVEIKLLTQ